MNIDYSHANLEIQSRHFFIREELEHARFARFFSADPRLPFSIAYPQHLEPLYDDTEYLNILRVTFGKGIFGVIRLDMTQAMEPEDLSQIASPIPLSMSPRIKTLLETIKNWGPMSHTFQTQQLWQAEMQEKLITVSEPGFQASHVVWKAGNGRSGEWVVFQFRSNLWTIFRNSIVPFSSDDFNTILSSFRFLDDAFFQALGVRWGERSKT